jgi:hypothetical protein
MFIALLGLGTVRVGYAQGFAAMVSPPRFELNGSAGKTVRAVFELSNRSTAPARYRIHTADWSFSRDYGVNFQDELQDGSCRPWVAIERPEVTVPGAGTLRYRFEVSVPADAGDGECRFAIMVEGAEPSIARSRGIEMPVTARIGVIVYVAYGKAESTMEVFGPTVANINGRQLPALRVHNSGNVHLRLSGFLTGTDAKGVRYDFAPSDFPVLPQEERLVFFTPSTATDDHPTLTFPVTVKGTLEWASQRTVIDQRFE